MVEISGTDYQTRRKQNAVLGTGALSKTTRSLTFVRDGRLGDHNERETFSYPPLFCHFELQREIFPLSLYEMT
jgi:hypothetical protein